MTGSPAGGSDEAANAAIGVVAGVAALAGVLRAAGSIAALLTGTPAPSAGLEAGIGIVLHPVEPGVPLGSPGLSPVAYWATVALLALTAAIAGATTWWLVVRLRDRRKTDPSRVAGAATRSDVARTAGDRALLARARTLRPSLEAPTPSDVGLLLGSSRGVGVWASVEDSILVLGPPRSGKGLHVVVNAILDAPGAVVTTSTRPDNLTATLTARQKRGGPVAVFDPQQLAPGIPAGLRWSPIRGCADPLTAMI